MEIATFVDNVSQFETSESDSMCVAFSAAQIIRMVAPGHANTSSTEDIDQLADQIYQSVTGSTTESTPISVEQLKEVLSTFGIRFQEIGIDVGSIDAALQAGYPLIVQASESGFRYLDGSSPYAWDVTPYNHCIIISGQSNNGGYEVRDSANSSGNPAIYWRNISPFSVIQIFPTWIGGTMIPQGWSDDGSTLTAPNGHKAVLGFRDYILNKQWDPNNVPLEEEYGVDPVEDYYSQSPSGGTRQCFLYGELAYTAARGVYTVGIGNELLGARTDRDQTKKALSSLQTEIDTLHSQIAALQSQVDGTTLGDVKAMFGLAKKIETALSQA